MTELDERIRRLWVAVLDQALRDALDPLARPVYRAQARGWIGTRDFAEVVEAAGLHPRAVLQQLNAREAAIAQALVAAATDGRKGRQKAVAADGAEIASNGHAPGLGSF